MFFGSSGLQADKQENISERFKGYASEENPSGRVSPEYIHRPSLTSSQSNPTDTLLLRASCTTAFHDDIEGVTLTMLVFLRS